jgi:hypothetical protein
MELLPVPLDNVWVKLLESNAREDVT